MRKFIMFLLISLILVSFSGCSEQEKAKNFGGTMEVTLPTNQKLVNITWKDDDLWYLTRPMHEDEEAEIYSFQEKSSYGVWEGTVKITEIKK